MMSLPELSNALTWLLTFIVGFLFVASLAPFEALGWWAGWYGRSKEDRELSRPTDLEAAASHYVVFLSGIHSASEETFARREIDFLNALRRRLTDTLVLEIFPYSVSNRALTGQRFFAWFWRIALRLKVSPIAFAGFVINLRNLFQVAVSADARYGPIYNQGTAETIYKTLLQNGYCEGCTLTLIGYSGGGQIAVGAAPYLKDILNTDISIISLGGIMCSDPGLLELKNLYHLVGTRDRVQRLGYLLFPGRWPIAFYSTWNQAKAKSIIESIFFANMDHTGVRGYLDKDMTLESGQSHLEHTVETIARLIKEQ